MTYKELLEFLKTLTDDELEQNVTVYLSSNDEYIPVIETDKTVENDVLDDGHVIITV